MYGLKLLTHHSEIRRAAEGMTVIHRLDSNLPDPDIKTLLAWQHVPDEITFGMFSRVKWQVFAPKKRAVCFQFICVNL